MATSCSGPGDVWVGPLDSFHEILEAYRRLPPDLRKMHVSEPDNSDMVTVRLEMPVVAIKDEIKHLGAPTMSTRPWD